MVMFSYGYVRKKPSHYAVYLFGTGLGILLGYQISSYAFRGLTDERSAMIVNVIAAFIVALIGLFLSMRLFRNMLRSLVNLCSFSNNESWVVTCLIYGLMCILLLYQYTFLLWAASLVVCGLISIVASEWDRDDSGFIDGIIVAYFGIANAENADFSVAIVIFYAFYFKFTETILRDILLWFNVTYLEQDEGVPNAEIR